MKPRLLHTCLQRSLRRSFRVMSTLQWRPMQLSWRRSARRAESGTACVSERAVHRHHHVALHFHFAPAADRMQLSTASALRGNITSLSSRNVATIHNERHELALHHTRIHDTRLHRQSTDLAPQRREREQVIPRAYAEPTHKHTHTRARQSVLAPAAARLSVAGPRRDVASSTARHSARSAPKPTSLTVPTSAHAQPMPANGRGPSAPLSLVWRAAPTNANASVDEVPGDIRVSAMAPATTTADTRALAPVAALVTPSQAREAVRTGLLDPAIADRLWNRSRA